MRVVLAGRAYWRSAFDIDFLAAPADRPLFRYAETARELWGEVLRWYRHAGETGFRPS